MLRAGGSNVIMMHLIPLPSQLTIIKEHSSTGKYVIDDDDAAQRCIYMCGIVALKHCADFSLVWCNCNLKWAGPIFLLPLYLLKRCANMLEKSD